MRIPEEERGFVTMRVRATLSLKAGSGCRPHAAADSDAVSGEAIDRTGSLGRGKVPESERRVQSARVQRLGDVDAVSRCWRCSRRMAHPPLRFGAMYGWSGVFGFRLVRRSR